VVSRIVFLLLHPEPSLFSIKQPILETGESPLSSANQVLPYMIFLKKPKWRKILDKQYTFSLSEFKFFSSLSYMMTGGISKKLPIPPMMYRIFLHLTTRAARNYRIFVPLFLSVD